MGVSVGIYCVAILVFQVDAAQPGLFQGDQLTIVCVAVRICITPDLECAPSGVLLIDEAILVAIQISQGGKTIGGQRAVLQAGVVAKQLCA